MYAELRKIKAVFDPDNRLESGENLSSGRYRRADDESGCGEARHLGSADPHRGAQQLAGAMRV
ncbi:hypothetical protein LNP74_29170 [Klebsiella pneumoniae subsp. pneumoniae]|nr:hypothetical protein [Klebsiella pneumoniae subsp. pneumoniae]